MTLVITAINRDLGIWQSSDHALTVAGERVDSDWCKQVAVFCEDGRALLGYSGLGRSPSSRSLAEQAWLNATTVRVDAGILSELRGVRWNGRVRKPACRCTGADGGRDRTAAFRDWTIPLSSDKTGTSPFFWQEQAVLEALRTPTLSCSKVGRFTLRTPNGAFTTRLYDSGVSKGVPLVKADFCDTVTAVAVVSSRSGEADPPRSTSTARFGRTYVNGRSPRRWTVGEAASHGSGLVSRTAVREPSS